MKKYFVGFLLLVSSCGKESGTDSIYSRGEILFLSRRVATGDWQLVRMNADGTGQAILSDLFVTCAPPVASNNGKRIAFTTYENNYYQLYVIDVDGQNLKLLSKASQYCGKPAWSPDDNSIVFVKSDDVAGRSNNIYSVDVTYGSERKLTSQNENFGPQFIPNSNKIIYSSSDGTFSGIYKMNSDGSGKNLLTPVNKSFGDPQVSSDGNYIAVTSIDWGGSQLYVMNNDGKNLKQITFTVSPWYFDIGFPRDGNCNPVWSPKGDKIAYVSYENGSPDIFIVNADGTGNKGLTNTPMRDENPAWTRDGKYILFSSNRNLNVSAEIYFMRPGGQSQTPLTNFIGDDIYPVHLNQ